jgi:Family of unknown function (DUF5998)
MTTAHDATKNLRAAIELAGYYPALVIDAVTATLGMEPVAAFLVCHSATFDPDLELRRHITVLALTPSRLIYSHTDEHPADNAEGGPPCAETATETVPLSRLSSVSVTRVVPDPASYAPGKTTPSELILAIGWGTLSHIEIGRCGDETCEADHYLGTITADDLTLRISQAADGEGAIHEALSFTAALNEAITVRT